MNDFIDTIKTIVYAIIIAIVVRTFAYEPFNIPSGSMIPTLLIGDYLFVSKTSYGYSKHSLPFSLPLIPGRVLYDSPERGDVFVFKTPADNKTDFIKRLIGLPGDKIQVKTGLLHINGKAVTRRRIEDFVDRDHYGNSRRTPRFIETLPNGVQHHILEADGDTSHFDNTKVFTVPEDHFFAMGDNRDNSSDSRAFGFVPKENLVGRAEFLFFSIDDAKPWQIWTWFDSLRAGRIFESVE
jgi:signal peptidase I